MSTESEARSCTRDHCQQQYPCVYYPPAACGPRHAEFLNMHHQQATEPTTFLILLFATRRFTSNAYLSRRQHELRSVRPPKTLTSPIRNPPHLSYNIDGTNPSFLA